MKNHFLPQEVVLLGLSSPQVKQIRHNRITAILEHEQAECDLQTFDVECSEPHQSVRILNVPQITSHEPSI